MAQELNFENMTQEEMQMLDALRNVSGRGVRGIGTSGLTGQDIMTAGEMVAEAPTSMETGYGPAEFNPQQRYGQRYQQRAGVGEDGPTAFDQLAQNVAMGNAMQGGLVNPRDYPALNPDGNGNRGEGVGGFGDARDSTDFGDMSLGHQTAQSMTPGSVGMDIMGGFIGPGIQSGLLGAVMGPTMGVSSTTGAVQGLGMGLKSALTAPMGWASAIDKAIGAAYGQSQLANAIDSMDVNQADITAAQQAVDPMAMGMGPRSQLSMTENMTPSQLQAAKAIGAFDTSAMSTRVGRGLAGMLGLGPAAVDDSSSRADQDASNRARAAGLASREALAQQVSSPVDAFGNLRSMQELSSYLGRAGDAATAEQAGINAAMNDAFGLRSEAGADMGGMVGDLDASFGSFGDMMGAIGGMFGGDRGDGGGRGGSGGGAGSGGGRGGDHEGQSDSSGGMGGL